MAYRWFKVYVEILDDSKMGRLSDRLWRRSMEMFAFARKWGDDGELPPIPDMAWTLHLTEDELTADLEALAALPRPIIQRRGDGWIVTNFVTRQAPETDEGRQAAKRVRDRAVKPDVTSRDNSVTVALPDLDLDQDLDQIKTETRQDKTGPESGAAAPSGPPDPLPAPPLSFSDWATRLQGSKNRPAVLREAFEALYPGRDPPEYSRLGSAGKAVGGAGRLLELLWQHSTRPPTGDVLAYCQGAAKSNGKETKRRGNDWSGPVTDWDEYKRKAAEAFAACPTFEQQERERMAAERSGNLGPSP